MRRSRSRHVGLATSALIVSALCAFMLPATAGAQSGTGNGNANPTTTLAPPGNGGADTQWPGGRWEPGPAAYGMTVVSGVEVTMDDGVVLHARVGYPTDLNTGLRAPGTFPVLLTQNPYTGGENPDLFYVSHGYIYVVAEVRGTGLSELSAANPDGPLAATNFGLRDGLDGARLVDF